jgi:hypothetical protein
MVVKPTRVRVLQITVLLLLILLSTQILFAQDSSTKPVEVNCDTSGSCYEIAIAADPIEHGCLVVDGIAYSDPCTIRGQFDPSLWQEDDTGTLWMAYTDVSLTFPINGNFDVFAPNFDTHLARSDDHGQTWQYVTKLTRTRPYDHPDFGGSVVTHEVADLAQNPDGSWSLIWLQYTQPYGQEGFNDPIIARKDALDPIALSNAPVQLHMSGWAESDYFPVEHKPGVDAGLGNCTAMTEPSIFTTEGRSFVVVECLSVNVLNSAFPLIPQQWTMELFEWNGEMYRHVGTLLSYDDARALTEGDAPDVSLAQPDVVQARNGDWLLLVTPINRSLNPIHRGCRVLTIDDITTAMVQRNDDGTPTVRASVVATSEHLGAGQCTYHADSNTGIVMGVGFSEGEGLRLHLLATGVHP